MALSGWGLTPGTLEKNVTRSLGGKYGAVGNNPTSIADMVRQKHAAGLQAKEAKERFDLSKTMEENRKAEAERDYGFSKIQAEKDWAYRQQQMQGDWRQQGLNRALTEKELALKRSMSEQQWAQYEKDYGLRSSAQKFNQNEAALNAMLRQGYGDTESATTLLNRLTGGSSGLQPAPRKPTQFWSKPGSGWKGGF